MGQKTPRNTGWLDRVTAPRFRWISTLLALLVSAVVLLPVLNSAFYGDDSWGSLKGRTLLTLTHTSLLQEIWNYQVGWITSQGRFFPLSAYVTVLYYVIDGNVLAYKVFIVCMVLTNLLLFKLVVTRITGSRALGLLAITLVPLAFQLRYADDPLTSYQGLIQVVLLLTLTALLALIAYLDTRKTWYRVAAVAAFSTSLLTYEVGLPLFLMFFLVAYLYPQRRSMASAAADSWPFAAAASVAVAIAVGLRLLNHVAIAGGAGTGAYAPNFDLSKVSMTLLNQTAASIPLSFPMASAAAPNLGMVLPSFAKPLPGFTETIAGSPVIASGLVVAYAALLAFACAWVAWEHANADRMAAKPSLSALSAVGVCLLVLPGVLISLSPKYQAGVWLGAPYLPVYMSYFGVGTLLALGLYYAVTRARTVGARMIPTIIAVVLGVFIIGVTYGDNWTVTTGYDVPYVFQRQVEQGALTHGIMSEFPDGAGLLAKGADWETFPTFFRLYAGKTVGVLSSARHPDTQMLSYASSSATAAAGTVHVYDTDRPLYALDYAGTSRTNGYATLGRVDEFTVRPDGSATDIMWAASRTYVSWDDSTGDWTSVVPSGFNPSEWILLSSGDHWKMFGKALPRSPGYLLSRAQSSSNRTMSSSPRYDPTWTSMTCSGSSPRFSIRCTAPTGMNMLSFVSTLMTSSSRVAKAVPATTTQCSLRCLWLWRLGLRPGLISRSLIW